MKKGFTLVELAIVLVIIGLLVGGVLQGQELIKQAQIRATIEQYREFDLATQTFKMKYNCLPGDCKIAESYGFNFKGDGNNTLDGAYGMEVISFWRHLAASGLIKGEYPDFNPNEQGFGGCNFLNKRCYPELKIHTSSNPFTTSFSKGWLVVTLTKKIGVTNFTGIEGGNYFWITGTLGGDSYGAAIIDPEQSENIDTKIDDGLPLTGIVMARSDSTYYSNGWVDSGFGPADVEIEFGQSGPESNVCVNDTTPRTYNVANVSGALCSLTIQSSF